MDPEPLPPDPPMDAAEFERYQSALYGTAHVKNDHRLRIPSVPPEDLPNTGVQSARVILKLCLYRTELSLSAPSVLSEEHKQLICNQTRYVQKYAQQDWLVRKWVGGSFDVWQDYQTCIDEALISIIPRMFLAPPAEEIPYQSATSFMCSHSASLIRDLERINELLIVARTLLVLNRSAQDFVVQSGTDQRILRLFEICLRVCARSNDSDSTENNEQICSAIVNICKSLLGTMLTVMNNMTTSNPPRMLCFWVDLFMRDTTEHLGLEAEVESEIFGERARGEFAARLGQEPSRKLNYPSPYEVERAILALDTCQKAQIATNNPNENPEHRRNAIRQAHLEMQPEIQKAAASRNSNTSAGKFAEPPPEPITWPPFAAGFPREVADRFKWIRGGLQPIEARSRSEREQAHKDAQRILIEDLQMAVPKVDDAEDEEPRSECYPRNYHHFGALRRTPAHHNLMGVPGLGPLPDNSNRPLSRPDREDEESYSDEDDDDASDDDDDERDPYGEAFRRRGIISELPLVLSPNDIMPLCVILQNAVWLDGNFDDYDLPTRLFKAIQCHILVSQETGKNLLREVLIFVAAWDLAEGDFAYSLIVEMIEAVLYHGLMPVAWQNYRESKDVVSPAQSVIVKTLGFIFRQRRKGDSPRKNPPDNLGIDDLPDEFVFDRGIIETLLEDFRTVVVPQTVALIWVQGQIRQKACLPEDFPLNIYEMERVYEGIYQFLELFAVLTETAAWKDMFVRSELSFELIALLRELENSIPKAPPKSSTHDANASNPISPPLHGLNDQNPSNSGSMQSATNSGTPGSVPVAVERPYEISPSPTGDETLSNLSPSGRLSPGQETLEEAEEASEFAWRNLKKLVVLVLGALAYKNPTVKTQVRELGGVELIMKCFENDEHNPYIREHAVLCLNFLLERSPENQAIAMDAGPSHAASATT